MKSREAMLGYLSRSLPRFRREYGVKRIGVFGSALREAAETCNDVDILVEMDSPTFDRYMDLKFELERRFGMPVDLVLADTLKERLRPIVESEVRYA